MRKPLSTKELTDKFLSESENSPVKIKRERGRPVVGAKTKKVTITQTIQDIEKVDKVIELAVSYRDNNGKMIHLSKSEAIRVSCEIAILFSESNSDLFEKIISEVKETRKM